MTTTFKDPKRIVDEVKKKNNTEFKLSLNRDFVRLVWENKIGKSFILASGALITVFVIGKVLRLLGTASNDYLHFRQAMFRHKKLSH